MVTRRGTTRYSQQDGYSAQTGIVPASAYAGRQVKSAKAKRWNVVFWISLLLFLVSAGMVLYYLVVYSADTREYEQLADEALELPTEDSVISLADLQVDWDYLYGINSQTVAWIYVPDTVVNLPVVWCGDNYTYLQRKFDGGVRTSVEFGCIFLSGDDQPDFSSANNILFGHSMKNGTMFSLFYRMAKNDTFNTYRDICILTPAGNYHLRTFAYVHVGAYETEVLATDFETPEEFEAFLAEKVSRTMFQPEGAVPKISDMSKVFSFITCDSASGAGRYVVYAYIVESTVPGVEGLGYNDPNSGGISQSDVDGLHGQTA